MPPQLIPRLTQRLFGNPIITNVVRGEIVEEIVAMALEPEWRHCGGDYASCDLVHGQTQKRMQVKQAAARQSWGLTKGNPRFSIAHKTGEWIGNGTTWVPGRSRNADIFLFGWHPLTSDEADHRDPEQWLFYLLAESALPDQQSIGLSALEALTNPLRHGELAEAAERLIVER